MNLTSHQQQYSITVIYSPTEEQQLQEARARRAALPKSGQQEVLYSRVCGHRVRKDVNRHCGCLA